MMDLIRKFNVLTVLIAILAFALGWQIGHRDVVLKWSKYVPTLSVENREPPKSVNINFRLFWDTWDLLARNYLDKKALDTNKMFYGAISGMVSAVGDPYTVFLPPQQQKSSREDLGGSFEGVGMELGFNKDKRLVVIAPLDSTPAQQAGILAQDMIIKIDDKDAQALSLLEAVNMIRGPKGTNVLLSIYREGEDQTREFNITRGTIVVKSVIVDFKKTQSGKKVAHMRLTRFGEKTPQEWNEAVSKVLAEGVSGVVLDVRNNPGGFLDGAVFIASEFLEDGDVVLQENAQGQRSAYKVNRTGKLLKIPMAVLINKGSASASEIVAGALQDRKRAIIVGEKSFGKGTIQESEELPGNTGIHITIAKWLTPDGRWVNSTNGFTPDVVIEFPKSKPGEEASKDSVKDVQLDKAIEVLKI